MKMKIHTTLIAGTIAALLAGPTWADSYTPKGSALTPAETKTGQPERDQSKAAQPMSNTPRTGAAAQGSGLGKTHDDSKKPDRAGATASTPIGDNPLYARSAADLDGMDVVDSTGNKVGEVKRIVLDPDRKSAHALISVSRVQGMDARDIMVSLDDLTPMDNKLQMSAAKAEIDALEGEAPDPGKYVEVIGNTPISGSIVEFSAFEEGNEADKPGATSTTPKGDTVKPGTDPASPKELQ